VGRGRVHGDSYEEHRKTLTLVKLFSDFLTVAYNLIICSDFLLEYKLWLNPLRCYSPMDFPIRKGKGLGQQEIRIKIEREIR
jgi:hypothetical protein